MYGFIWRKKWLFSGTNILVAIFMTSVSMAAEIEKLELPDGAKQLDPEQSLWIDTKQSQVILNAKVVLREGVLEMFACTEGTKEHESVISVEPKAFLIHTALLAIGAEPGQPVQFEPKFIPPSGDPIKIVLNWIDEKGKQQTAIAQEWIRKVKTKKQMQLPFVFAGSGFYTIPDTGRQRYLAEKGDLFCVSNFGSAMLDVPIESTQSNEGLLFEPFTERIPIIDTTVQVVLSVDKAKEAGR